MKHKRQTHISDIYGEISKTTVVDDSGELRDEDASICGLLHGRLGVRESNSFQNDLSTLSGQPCNDNDMQTFKMFSNSFMEKSLKATYCSGQGDNNTQPMCQTGFFRPTHVCLMQLHLHFSICLWNVQMIYQRGFI